MNQYFVADIQGRRRHPRERPNILPTNQQRNGPAGQGGQGGGQRVSEHGQMDAQMDVGGNLAECALFPELARIWNRYWTPQHFPGMLIEKMDGCY